MTAGLCSRWRRAALRLGGTAAVLLVAATAFARGPLAVHEYLVRVDDDLGMLDVEVRFDGRVHSVTARSRHAGRYLTDFDSCGETSRIRMRNRRMILPAEGIGCMRYTVALREAARERRHNRALAGDNLVLSPSVWLWRPEVTDRSELRVRFALPAGVAVAAPWQPVSGARHLYRVRKSPESASAPIVFGRFTYAELAVPGATLRVSLLRGTEAMDEEAILRWVRAAATDITLAYGRFPNPSPQVLVIPVADERRETRSAVPYGRVVRDGGETVELFVNQRRPLAAFLDDWTATHEFSHLMLPYVQRSHRWISEGFAQYYQNVLLARSGAYDAQRAWQKLYEGFERGRLAGPALSPNDAAAGGSREARMKVYWSGAALALMADVALREQGGGESLDTLLKRLQSCCLPSDRVWTGPELFATLDSLAGQPLFMPLYDRYADAAGFPDTSGLFARLGLSIRNGRVHIDHGGALDGIRSAITATDPETALWREHLSARNR